MMNLRWRSAIPGLLLVAFSVALTGQSASIAIDQLSAGDRNVTGQAIGGSVPLTVYDVSAGARNYLGKSVSMDQQGYYAVAVSPLLTDGQKIIVIDALGHSSGTATVTVKIGPAGPVQ
jgi:hypothetical protein